jgi:hypothetical protein
MVIPKDPGVLLWATVWLDRRAWMDKQLEHATQEVQVGRGSVPFRRRLLVLAAGASGHLSGHGPGRYLGEAGDRLLPSTPDRNAMILDLTSRDPQLAGWVRQGGAELRAALAEPLVRGSVYTAPSLAMLTALEAR